MAKAKLKRAVYLTAKGASPVVDAVFAPKVIRNNAVNVFEKLIERYPKKTNQKTKSNTYKGPWLISVDSPKIAKQITRKVYVSGWFVPKIDVSSIKLRFKNPDGSTSPIKYNIERIDVVGSLSHKLGRSVSTKCGFEAMLELSKDGNYIIESSLDNKNWKKVYKLDLFYDPDYLARDLYVQKLEINMPEHITLLESKKKYFHEDSKPGNYELHSKDPKLVAFYLPQFHPIKENDIWWGKGFTEWTNVSSATPQFIGHEQPKLPADLGFYDLRNPNSIADQMELAKKHGVYGFCIYYYWFSGKRLLEQPLDIILENKQWDFNFMICWANENWTRRWDGRQEDVLIEQKHNDSDPLDFIKDVENILLDPRYIRRDGKPVLMVYRASDLIDPNAYTKTWRDYFKKTHNTELHIISVQSFNHKDPRDMGFDRGVDFVPLSIAASINDALPPFPITGRALDKRFTGPVYDYRKIALNITNNQEYEFPTYKSIMPGWDNNARKKNNGGVFQDSNPDIYGKWLDDALGDIQKTKEPHNEFLFVNAWNEWAEGAYLEPDSYYGHAYLNRTSEILSLHSKAKSNIQKFPLYSITKSKNIDLAVVIHLYYIDLWPIFEKQLTLLNDVGYDLFVSIPPKNSDIIESIKAFKKDATVTIVPNRGRDVLPFMHIARRLNKSGYKYVLKLHSKKSTHRVDGEKWLLDMLNKLIPNTTVGVKNLIHKLNEEATSVIGPKGHYVSLNNYFGSNKDNIESILQDTSGVNEAENVINNTNNFGFFAGTMFWIRLDSIKQILDLYFQPSDFESENGQVDGTKAHALERVFCVLPEVNHKKLYTIDNDLIEEVITNMDAKKVYEFAEKNKQNDK